MVQIKGDRTKLMQVFLNLLKNAADSVVQLENPEQAKEINVAVGRGKTSVKVIIQDNGRGFDEATGAKLFTRGYTTKAEGTGLGLANCKNIIEGHNGQIYLTSAGIGQGATSVVIFNI